MAKEVEKVREEKGKIEEERDVLKARLEQKKIDITALQEDKTILENDKKTLEAKVSDLERLPGARMEKTVNGVTFAFRWCPHGTFLMGSPETENRPKFEDNQDGKERQHQVALTKGFWILETEVTVGMYDAFVKDNDEGYDTEGNVPEYCSGQRKVTDEFSWRNPGFEQSDRNPVTCVSWNDATKFCEWLSKKLGENVTLPTEAQWEYACRAGTTGPFAGNLAEMAWYWDEKQEAKTHPAGTKKPNAWGLYDMHGNVWEWCQDWSGLQTSESVVDPTGPSEGTSRVVHGGSYTCIDLHCRSARRGCNDPEDRLSVIGFRCVIVP